MQESLSETIICPIFQGCRNRQIGSGWHVIVMDDFIYGLEGSIRNNRDPGHSEVAVHHPRLLHSTEMQKDVFNHILKLIKLISILKILIKYCYLTIY